MYQIKRRTKAVSSLKILAAIGLTLGLSSWALGQDCGLGDFVSAEPCLADGDTDTVNGGCNSDPDAFSEAAVLNGSVSGTVSTYAVGSPCPWDLDLSGAVGTGDLLALFAQWGQVDTPGDFDGGGVSTSDLLILFANWGPCPPPAGSSRDTDWYLLSHADLVTADVDGNGVVVVSHTGSSEAPVVLFIVSIGDPACGAVSVIGQTGSAGDINNIHCIANTVEARALIDIANHPNGIVFYIAPGNPDGSAIFTGYPCAPGPGTGFDYLINLVAVDLAFAACTFDGEPCNIPTPGVPGCSDPDCCNDVCEFDSFCCTDEWDAICVDTAINVIGCAIGIGAPVLLATGPDSSVDGYLDLFADGYGSEANFGAGPNQWEDNYNPVGANLQSPGFTETTFLFTGATDRIILSLNSDSTGAWGGSTMNATFLDPSIVDDVFGADGIADQVINHFEVTGALTLDVIAQQNLETSLSAGGDPIATWRLSYEIRNDAGAEATFEIVRWLDLDLNWAGDFMDDTVGTGTNAGVGCDVYVSQGEVGLPNTAITLSTDFPGAQYVGSKLTFDPDCAGPIIPFGFGTDPNQYWDPAHNGLPAGWENIIAGVGNNTDGDSGASPADACGNNGTDGAIGLFVPVTLGAGATTTVTFLHTYGAITPNGAVCSK